MKRLIELHVKVYNYVIALFKSKKKYHEKYKISLMVLKSYLIELAKIYVLMFRYLDFSYLKAVANQKKQLRYRKEIKMAYKIIKFMINQGKNRAERKQIRNDFVKHGRISKEIEQDILNNC